MDIDKVLEKIPGSGDLVGLIRQDLNNKTGFAEELAKKILPDVMSNIHAGKYPDDPHIKSLVNQLKQKYPQTQTSGGNDDEDAVVAIIVLGVALGAAALGAIINYLTRTPVGPNDPGWPVDGQQLAPYCPSNIKSSEVKEHGSKPHTHEDWDDSRDILKQGFEPDIFVNNYYKNPYQKLSNDFEDTELFNYVGNPYSSIKKAMGKKTPSYGLYVDMLQNKYYNTEVAKQILLNTGTSNIYNDISNGYWGIGSYKDSRTNYISPGKNIIGIILMEIRERLKTDTPMETQFPTATELGDKYYKPKYAEQTNKQSANSQKTNQQSANSQKKNKQFNKNVWRRDHLGVEASSAASTTSQKNAIVGDYAGGAVGGVIGGVIKLAELKLFCSLFVCCIFLMLLLIYVIWKLPGCSWRKEKSCDSRYSYL